METPLSVHEGKEPYIFVSYSRTDTDVVLPEIRWLQQQGVNVWYDAGIRPGSEWSDALANAIAGCSGFFYFITPQSVASENCRRELNFALEEDRQVLAVHLTDTDLPRGVRLSLNNRQAVIRSQFEQQPFREKLLAFARQPAAPVIPRADPVVGVVPAAATGTRDRSRRTSALAIGAVLVIVAALSAFWFWRQASDEHWATQDMLPAIRQYIAADDFGPAFTLATAVEARLGSDYLPAEVWDQIAATVSIDSAPPGAKVSYRQYAESGDGFIELGESPVKSARVPRTMLLLKAEKTGYAPAYRITNSPGIYLRDEAPNAITRYPAGQAAQQPIELVAENTLPADMVRVPQSQPGNAAAAIPAFLIDRYETSNRDYQAFVDAGGYTEPAYWRALDFRTGDQVLDWQSAVGRFVDATGHAGPITWELGKYPDGEADLPVTGVSWYEAAAYAKYRGKSLPTVVHWTQAASGADPAFAGSIISLSNFGGHLREIGNGTAIGPYGAYDLFGNAREWTANASGVERVVMGAAASDAPYTAVRPIPASPWDRSDMTGIRCAIYLEPVSATLLAAAPLAEMPPLPPAIPEEVLDAGINSGGFLSFESKGVVIDERHVSGSLMRRVSLSTGLADERFDVYVIIPEDATPPYQTLVYMSGDYAFKPNTKLENQINWEHEAIFKPILRTGRVVIWPTWYASFTRYDGLIERSSKELAAGMSERYSRWRRDAAAVLDYVASSGEFSDKIGFLGLSYGAIQFGIAAPFAPPFKGAILLSASPIVDQSWQVTYFRRMTLPTLILKGRYDKVVPVEWDQRFYELYGASAEDKRLVIYDAEHWPLPRNQMAREMSSWLDRYLGPVGAPAGAARVSLDE